jgi:hypothetical protein
MDVFDPGVTGEGSTMHNPNTYEAPAVEALGTVAELTEAAGLTNSDNGLVANNAFSNP